MTQRLCKVCDGWHDPDNWPMACYRAPPDRRSKLAGPSCISDTMGAVQSMLDGRMYDSKSALRRTYKAAGMTEVGGEKPKPFKKPRPDRTQIKAAVERAFSQAGLGA